MANNNSIEHNQKGAIDKEYEELWNGIARKCDDAHLISKDYPNPYLDVYGIRGFYEYDFENGLKIGYNKAKNIFIISKKIPINRGEVPHIVIEPNLIAILAEFKAKHGKQSIHMSTDSHMISHYFIPDYNNLYYTEPLSLENIEKFLIEEAQHYKDTHNTIVQKYKKSGFTGIPDNYLNIYKKYQKMLKLFRSTLEFARGRKEEKEYSETDRKKGEDAAKRTAIRKAIDGVKTAENSLKEGQATQK